jgi:bla regulator protein BlaR1
MIGMLGDHLWQSTLFAAAAAALALALRRNRAHVRYWLWLAASVKFLVPFALLMALGNRLEWGTAVPIAQPEFALAIDAVSQPFSSGSLVFDDSGGAAPIPSSSAVSAAIVPMLLAAVWLVGTLFSLGVWARRWRRVAAAAAAGLPVTGGREHDILRRLEQRAGVAAPIALVLSKGALEPGVFGILRPVLLWPVSIGERLTDQQVEAIVAHEIAHVRRRDNLFAALHMLVQAIFWFHPLVWWLGARLVDERERACDHEVLRLGSEPDVYAEGILKTVQFYVESPMVCVAGVTGSDLKRRIEEIMRNHAGMDLTSLRKLLLVTAAAAAIGVPILLGGINNPVAAQTPAPADDALTFETASVKPNRSGEGRVMMRNLPGGSYEATNVTARAMIQQAMQVAGFQLIGAPDWLDAERYDVLAKSPAGAAPTEFAERYRNLIEERFKLETHRETREMPVYALVLARSDGKLGPKLVESKSDCSPEGMAAMRAQMNAGAPAAAGVARGTVPMMMMSPMPPLGEPRPCSNMRGGNQITAGGSTPADIARMLQQNTGRIVLDRTGLTGRYDFDLAFTPDPGLAGRGPGGGLPPAPGPQNARPPDPDAITIFTAVQEQLGLKLESTRGPVDVVVIDSVERATEN